jgi:hypothetical protein
MRLRSTGQLRILDFDIETRKVGFHIGGKFGPDGCEPITIAASWVGSKRIDVWPLPTFTVAEMVSAFSEMYRAADMVTGHYIRKFDLPILQAALFENGLPLLPQKLTCDTKGDLVNFSGLSKSQENLGALLELAEGKYHMNDHRWRKSSRLDPVGAAEARKRAREDVRQHKALRLALWDAGALGPPRMWS